MPMTDPSGSVPDHIFLSYSRNDDAACAALRSELERAGFGVFKDDRSIRAGDRWVSRLEQALADCAAFVVLIGRDGVARWIGAEVQVALTRHLSPHDDSLRLPIFPILLGDTPPEALPPLLGLFQAARWSPGGPLPDSLPEAIRARASRFETGLVIDGCPFLGLGAFGPRETRLFFGRRQETLEALAALGDQREGNPERLGGAGAGYQRWLQVEGNSGSGKSSLVMAGLLPMIERGALWARTGFERCRVLGPMMPGQDPLAKLAEVLEAGLVADPAQRDSLERQHWLKQDERALARRLRDCREDDCAFLLIIDQFEELFTLAEPESRLAFDKLLAHALQDPDCPLLLITTVRADFLDRYELLPALQGPYNSLCKRYFLPLISGPGLREAIEGPARLAGLDVSEVTTAMLEQARDEPGALPLVENALTVLWQQRTPGSQRLSGELYQTRGGLAGLLSAEADALLDRIGHAVPQGRRAALELLFGLTRINDAGRHSRRRLTRKEAVDLAGAGDAALGEQVLRWLSGERPAAAPAAARRGVSRLVTLVREPDQVYVDLIHETLIRARKDANGQATGYWPTLYDYIEKNRDRDLHRQQLALQAAAWRRSRGLGRWWNLAGWGDRRRYRRLRLARGSLEARFLAWSRWMGRAQAAVLALLIGALAETGWWASRNNLPFGYAFLKPLWALGLYTPLPRMVTIPAGSFTMGCLAGRDDVERPCEKEALPPHLVTFARPFRMGVTEVTFLQYDYFVWDRQRRGDPTVAYPGDDGFGRYDRPVINVSWRDAQNYLKWLSAKTGEEYRLPSEAEWEYAARAGATTVWWWGDRLGKDDANVDVEGSRWGGRMTAPVGSFKPNPWGLYDTAGNVWEWVEDAWRDDYRGAPVDGAAWTGQDDAPRALRGGSWLSRPDLARADVRNGALPDLRSNPYVGFRVLSSVPMTANP